MPDCARNGGRHSRGAVNFIALKHGGFGRRITNRVASSTQFDVEEIRMLYTLRVELETLALQWAYTRVTAADLSRLTHWHTASRTPAYAETGRPSSNVILTSIAVAGNFPAMRVSPTRWSD